MTEWILYDISDLKESEYNAGEEFITLKFFEVETKREAYTHITIGHNNNAWWAKILTDDIFGIYKFNSFKWKNKNTRLIDGDSIPKLVQRASRQEAFAVKNSIKNG